MRIIRSTYPSSRTPTVPISSQGQVVGSKSAEESDPKKRWLPVSDWAGRLILPKESERKEGGVYLEVLQAPRAQAHLKGKKVWLTLKGADWIERVTRDVQFTDRTKNSEGQGNVHPDRINGWKRVSPLESIAGARPKDDVLVSLENIAITENGLEIASEPVQVSGTQKALVTFEEKVAPHSWQIRHWNPETKDFSGPKEVVDLTGRDDLAPMKDRRLNGKGWYLYGDQGPGGRMTVDALEPRELFQVTTDQSVAGEAATLNYLNCENWRVEQLRQGEMTKTLLRPQVDPKAPLTPLAEQMKEAFNVGDKALLVHLFGGVEGEKTLLGLHNGHFSFGLAEVVEDPFTGEPRFDIEYKQVYAHNADGIISGNQKWHAYMGDTHRGHLFQRPVSDALLKVPQLFDDGRGHDPSVIFEERLSEMNARYRSGDGDGLSKVTAARNCSQDSSQALYAAVSDWRQAIADGRIAPELMTFCQQLTGHLTPLFGWAPSDWEKMANKHAAKTKKLSFLPALKSLNTVLPRSNADGLTEMALKADFPVMLFKTDVLGTENLAVPAEPVRDLNPFN
jgi:predicted Abi (CAAX) family protease